MHMWRWDNEIKDWVRSECDHDLEEVGYNKYRCLKCEEVICVDSTG